MSNKRRLVFANEAYYHVYNRGIDKRVTFTNKREYTRALELLWFYQYATIPLRYSRFIELPEEIRQRYYEAMSASGKIVDVIAYCLMPNHFHLLVKQKQEKGIATYIANFINAYTKYFNTKHKRTGVLFQGVFKAVYIESEEQLLHLTRYIHLNPVTSYLIEPAQLKTFPWSSHRQYLENTNSKIVATESIALIKSLVSDYESFIHDQVSYARELEKIKHITYEHE